MSGRRVIFGRTGMAAQADSDQGTHPRQSMRYVQDVDTLGPTLLFASSRRHRFRIAVLYKVSLCRTHARAPYLILKTYSFSESATKLPLCRHVDGSHSVSCGLRLTHGSSYRKTLPAYACLRSPSLCAKETRQLQQRSSVRRRDGHGSAPV